MLLDSVIGARLYPTVLYFVGAHEISSPPATPGVQILQTAGTVR